MPPARPLLLACFVLAAALPVAAQHQHQHPHQHQQGGHRGNHSAHASPTASPYAGEQSRDIKALSAQEQRGWTEGQGMGLARAAELNGYPGPMHVLELAGQLQLTDSQAAATRALMDAHKAEVRGLGTQLVDAERQLDALFRERRATEADVRHGTEGIGQLQARIRAAHLATHLKQTQILSVAQVDQYNKLRGYR